MTEKMNSTNAAWTDIFRKQIFIPIAALLILAVFNLIVDPSFFKITLGHNSTGDPVLTGYLMTILDYGSEVAILAIGMTLVTAASGGQDISVGAAVAIAGSVILRVLVGRGGDGSLQAPILVAFLIACVAGMLCGAFNGVLVSVFKIQPMVATLILYTAGRSIAAWINNNELPIVTDKSFTYFGGFIPGVPIPTPFFLAVICVLITMLVLKFTNLGLYTQAVGINASSSRLNGLNPTFIKWLTFVILGLCVAVVALIKTSRLSTINRRKTVRQPLCPIFRIICSFTVSVRIFIFYTRFLISLNAVCSIFSRRSFLIFAKSSRTSFFSFTRHSPAT